METKIDRIELYQMLKDGKTGVECAEYFNVRPSAISMARKELNLSVVKNIGLETAHKVVTQELDTFAQLQKVNEKANDILDQLTGDGRVIDRLAKAVEGFSGNQGGDIKQVRQIIRKLLKDKDTALKAMKEIRGQLNFQLEMYKTWYNVEETAAFQREVLRAVAEVDSAVRDKIVTNLKRHKLLRQSVKLT